ncbi:hypothetical protein D3C72_1079570 [compost metagenome]
METPAAIHVLALARTQIAFGALEIAERRQGLRIQGTRMAIEMISKMPFEICQEILAAVVELIKMLERHA